jgi:hypothetical protein
MADAAHPFMPSLRRQQDVQLRIVQRGKGDDGIRHTAALRLKVQPMRLIQSLRPVRARIDMDSGHRVPVGQIAAVILGQIIPRDGLDTAVGAIVVERPGQPWIAQMIQLPQVDMRIDKGNCFHHSTGVLCPTGPLSTGAVPVGGINRWCAPRCVEHRCGGEGAFLAGHKADHGGAFLDLAQTAHGDLAAHVIDLALGQLRQDRALEGRRGQRIGDHALAGQFLAQRFGQADHGCLAGAVGAGIGIAFLARDRGQIDDAPVTTRQHMRRNRPVAVEQTVDVDVEHPLPALDGVFMHGAVAPVIPAEQTSTSTLPSAAMVCAAAAATASASDTSSATVCDAPTSAAPAPEPRRSDPRGQPCRPLPRCAPPPTGQGRWPRRSQWLRGRRTGLHKWSCQLLQIEGHNGLALNPKARDAQFHHIARLQEDLLGLLALTHARGVPVMIRSPGTSVT